MRRALSIPNLTMVFPGRRSRSVSPDEAAATSELPDLAAGDPAEPDAGTSGAPDLPMETPAAEAEGAEPLLAEALPDEPAPTAGLPDIEDALPPGAEEINLAELMAAEETEIVNAHATDDACQAVAEPDAEIDADVVAETADGEASEPDAGESSHTPHRPSREFVYVAEALVTPLAMRARREAWGIVITFVLALAFAGILLYWHHSARMQPLRTHPQQVAVDYLLALAMHDTTTVQQLATDDSRGLLLPYWFTLVEARAEGAARITGRTAAVTVRLRLAPAGDVRTLPPALQAAAEKPYTAVLPLAKQGQHWQVNQRGFFRNLHWQFKQHNPGAAFPMWRGVSQ